MFRNLDEALQVLTASGPGYFKVDFTLTQDGRTQRHIINVLKYPGTTSSFLGNWQVSEAGKPDLMDGAFCTLH